MASFPEVDRAEWCPLDVARVKLNPAQVAFLDRLVDALGVTRQPRAARLTRVSSTRSGCSL